MIDWMLAPVELPRWVVWCALLTNPAVWSRQAKKMVRDRWPGDS